MEALPKRPGLQNDSSLAAVYAQCICVCKQLRQMMCQCVCGSDRQSDSVEPSRVFLLSYISGSQPACHPNAAPLDPIRQAEHGSRPAVCSDYGWQRIV